MAGLPFGKGSREKAGGTGNDEETAPLAKARSTRQAARGKRGTRLPAGAPNRSYFR